MINMNLKEYTDIAKIKIREYLWVEPQEELEEYIDILEKEGYIKESYEVDISPVLAEILKCEMKPDPQGLAFEIAMLYPDFPPKYEK